MSERFKNVTLGKRGGGYAAEPTLVREFSEETQKYIDDEIASMMDERYNYVLNLLGKHKDLLEYIANRLLEIETMDGKEFYEIVNAEKNCVKTEVSADSGEKKSVRTKKVSAASDEPKKTVRRTRKAKTEE